jgi:hypothetical protein
VIHFILSTQAAHTLRDTSVLAPRPSWGSGDLEFEFEGTKTSGEIRIACTVSMARFILAELGRMGADPHNDVELSFALTEAAIIVRRALATCDQES